MKENNERYDIISKATNDIIWDWDIVTNKVKWIGQGLKNYLPPDKISEKIPNHFWVNGLHPEERRNVVSSIFGTITAGEASSEIDYRFLRNDGTYAHINSRGYVIKNDEQKAIRMIGSMQDITERKMRSLKLKKPGLMQKKQEKPRSNFWRI